MEQQVQSEILSDEQLQAIVAEEQGEAPTDNQEVVEEEVSLPSEEEEFSIPDKFKDKSAEDIAKAYVELEKMYSKKNTQKEETTEEVQKEEAPKEEDPEFVQWKQEKLLNNMLEPVGGLAKYKEAMTWAQENLSSEEIKDYNAAIAEAEGSEVVIKALTKSMVDKYIEGTKVPNDPIHSGETAKVTPTKGYETKSDMLKDLSDPRYERDATYRAKVEAKIAKTDESKWYSGLPNY